MSEERLQEIKDSVNFQREVLLANNMGTLCVDEEQELIEEIERLNKENEHLITALNSKESIIKEVREYIKYQLEHLDFEKDTKAKILGAMVLVMLDEEKK